jgi:predicted transcriptional regulator
MRFSLRIVEILDLIQDSQSALIDAKQALVEQGAELQQLQQELKAVTDARETS